MTRKIKALETLATQIVGDGKSPDLYFVTDSGTVVTVTQDFGTAYRHWSHLAARFPRRESALENRNYGVICSVEPKSDEDGACLIVRDDHLNFQAA